jgi:hypothetical protein
VDVLQHNRQRGFCGRRVYRVGQIVDHPIAQIRRAAQPAQRLCVSNRGILVQRRHEQREKRHRLLIFERLAEQGAHPGLVGKSDDLAEQPALADARWALDDQRAPASLDRGRHQCADHLQLFGPTADRRSREPLSADIEKAR